MNQKPGTALILSIIVLITISFRAYKSAAQNQQKDEATIVQKGNVTEKEREYSKEFKKLYSDRKGRNLGELSELGRRRGNAQEAGISIGLPLIPTIDNSPAETPSKFLNDISCKSDVVVVGLVTDRTAHLTEDETFAYTEYDFSVEGMLKNNPASPIEINDAIQVTRPGGLIKLDNHVMQVEDKSYAPLELQSRYLLFLRYIPSANGYMVSDVKGDFILEKKSFRTLSRLGVPKELENSVDSQTLLREVHNSVSVGCN